MSGKEHVVYLYDGSMQGLLCCVFTAVAEKEMPVDIWVEHTASPVLFDTKAIHTDENKAKRVEVSIPKKMSPRAKELVRNVFFSNAEQKELKILRFLLLGYQVGPQLCKMLAHPDVAPMLEAEKSLLNEVHLLKGFLRFSDYDGVLGAVIGPKHYVLPLLAPHFCGRFGNENFMIWDKTHKAVLYWANKKAEIFDMEEFSPPQPSASEQQYQQLWKEFYSTISIAERENLPCRQNHCPKRYWQYMTEMQQEISKGHL